jgi:hypothetical protein
MGPSPLPSPRKRGEGVEMLSFRQECRARAPHPTLSPQAGRGVEMLTRFRPRN